MCCGPYVSFFPYYYFPFQYMHICLGCHDNIIKMLPGGAARAICDVVTKDQRFADGLEEAAGAEV